MVRLAGRPLRKITLNLYDSDVQLAKSRWGYGWSEHIRDLVHDGIKRSYNPHQVEPAIVEDLDD